MLRLPPPRLLGSSRLAAARRLRAIISRTRLWKFSATPKIRTQVRENSCRCTADEHEQLLAGPVTLTRPEFLNDGDDDNLISGIGKYFKYRLAR